MHLSFACRQAAQSLTTMIKLPAIRSVRAKGVVNCLLANCLPKLSSAELMTSTVALRERIENTTSSDSKRNPVFVPWTYRNPALDVAAGGGPRPKVARQWRTKTKRGSIAKSEKLIDVVKRLPNSKEEVYGALDAWIAWDLEFPLIAVKKALKTLKEEDEWRRIIQVTKWMLDKGQGRTLGTYQLLLQAFDREGRIEEAQMLWEKVLRDNVDCVPRTMFAQVISMYYRNGKYKEVLKVFAEMDELEVKADSATIQRVARSYEHFGYGEYAQSLLEKYTAFEAKYRFVKGKKVKIRPQEGEVLGGQPRNAVSVILPARQSIDADESSLPRKMITNVGTNMRPEADDASKRSDGLDGKGNLQVSTETSNTQGISGLEEQRLEEANENMKRLETESGAELEPTSETAGEGKKAAVRLAPETIDEVENRRTGQTTGMRYEPMEEPTLDKGSEVKRFRTETSTRT